MHEVDLRIDVLISSSGPCNAGFSAVRVSTNTLRLGGVAVGQREYHDPADERHAKGRREGVPAEAPCATQRHPTIL